MQLRINLDNPIYFFDTCQHDVKKQIINQVEHKKNLKCVRKPLLRAAKYFGKEFSSQSPLSKKALLLFLSLKSFTCNLY